MGIRQLLSYPAAQGPGMRLAGETPKQFTYLDPKNITYPGVAVIAGAMLNFTEGDAGVRLWVSLVIALLFGGFILYLGLTDENNAERKIVQVFTFFVNTFLLWVTIFSVSVVSPQAITGS